MSIIHYLLCAYSREATRRFDAYLVVAIRTLLLPEEIERGKYSRSPVNVPDRQRLLKRKPIKGEDN